MKNLHKKMIYSLMGVALTLLTLVGRTGISQLIEEVDMKETTLDSTSDDDAGEFPLLGLLLEAENRFEIPVFKYNKVALDSCEAETLGIKDLTPMATPEFKNKACVENDKNLYEIESLHIKNCHWTEQESTKQSVSAFSDMEKNFHLENIKIRFEDDELFCVADLVTANNQKFPMKGNCAITNMAPFKTINGKKPDVGNDPVFVIFDMDEKNAFFEKEMAKDKIGKHPHLLVSVSIPLTQKASDYLAYMLSNEAIQACDATKK